MKRIYILLFLFVYLVTGCEDYNSNKTSDNSNSNTSISNRLIKKVEYESLYATAVMEYEYDDLNRVSSVSEKIYEDGDLFADNVYYHSYDSDGLIVIGSMNEDRYGEMTRFSVKYTYEFKNGLLISELWEQTWGNYSIETTFHYDSKNTLSRKVSEDFDEGEISFEWKSGNIIKGDYWDMPGTYSYTSAINKANLDILSLAESCSYQFDPTTDKNVFKGIHSKNLVNRYDSDDTDSIFSMIFSYEYDSQGYPVEITIAWFSDDPENNGLTETYSIEYYK